MLQVKPITKDSPQAAAAKQLLIDSFDESELMPFSFLLRKAAQKDFVEFLAFYDETTFAGITYLVTYEDLTLVLYLAVNPEARSKGYGGQILEAIQARYPNNRITLDIEVLDDAADNNEQRIRRRNFYMRHGFKDTGLIIIEGKNIYDILISSGSTSVKEYNRLYRRFLGSLLYLLNKAEVKEA